VEKKNSDKVIEHRLRALLAAEESQNLKMKYSKNLGFDYGDLQQDYKKGLEYLTYSQKLAKQLGDKASQSVILRDMGAFSFWMQQYEEAIEYYQQSYQIFAHLGYRNSQAIVCAALV
jgi:tetratricopeptide (TPR) repeat protein